MQLTRPHLTVLLNALYDTDTTTIPVEHPSDEVGELFRIELDDSGETTVRMTMDLEAYADARSDVNGAYGPPRSANSPISDHTLVRSSPAGWSNQLTKRRSATFSPPTAGVT